MTARSATSTGGEATAGPTRRERYGPTGTRATRVIGVLALLGLPLLLLLGLVTSPPDVTMGDSVRIMYVHVPSAWLAYLAFGVTALCSLLYLWKRTRSLTLDRFAGASAEIGVLFTGLALVTGMLWGRPTWGVYWTWDARLTSTALLFLLFLGYLAIRRLPAPPEVRAKRAAIAGLIAFVDVPIVHLSVDWWRSLHQDATVVRRDLNAELDGTMLFTLFFGLFVFTLIYVWLLLHRQRQLWLEDHQGQTSLDQAIAERRAEATTRPRPRRRRPSAPWAASRSLAMSERSSLLVMVRCRRERRTAHWCRPGIVRPDASTRLRAPVSYAQYVIPAYVAVVGSVAAFAAFTVVRGRRLARGVRHEDKPWT